MTCRKVILNIFTLNDKQRPGKDKEMNLRYSKSKYTDPFIFCFFFQQLEKTCRKNGLTELTFVFRGLRMDKPCSPDAGEGPSSPIRVSNMVGPGASLHKTPWTSLPSTSQNDQNRHLQSSKVFRKLIISRAIWS